MPTEEFKDYYDYKIHIKKDDDINETIQTFFTGVGVNVVGDTAVVSAEIKKQVEAQRAALESLQKDDPGIVGKSVAIRHHVAPALNDGREFFIYLINVFA